MKQFELGLKLLTKMTRKREFLEEMERVDLWRVLVQLVEPYYPKARTGRSPFCIETMLRLYYLEQWFALSAPAMEEALHDRSVFRDFAMLRQVLARLPDETMILTISHLLEKHGLATDILRLVKDIRQAKRLMIKKGPAVDATLLAGPRSSKNAEGERDAEMKHTKKGNQWYFGTKAQIGVDAHSRLAHSVVGMASIVNDVMQAGAPQHGQETYVYGDSVGPGAHRRPKAVKPTRHVAMRLGMPGAQCADQAVRTGYTSPPIKDCCGASSQLISMPASRCVALRCADLH